LGSDYLTGSGFGSGESQEIIEKERENRHCDHLWEFAEWRRGGERGDFLCGNLDSTKEVLSGREEECWYYREGRRGNLGPFLHENAQIKNNGKGEGEFVYYF